MPHPAAPDPATAEAACVLAFDTSTERLAVGLSARHGCLVAHAEGGASASATLLPLAQGLLLRAGLSWADLQFIAFGSGPGAFTGLRTAAAVAQGLGLGLGVPLLPIDSLLIVAEDARAALAPVAPMFEVGVAMDARMDEAYTGRYRWQAGHWQVLDAPALCPAADLGSVWAGLPLQALAGSALPAFGTRVAWPALPRLAHEADRAGALLRLALLSASATGGIDAALALPLYVRDKVAFTTQEREAARRQAAAAA